MRTRILASLPLCALCVAAHAADTWDLASDFSITNGNPNGVWTYGQMNSGPFNSYGTTYTSSFGIYWTDGYATDIWRNEDSSSWYGIDSGQISLHADGGVPTVRFTAPYTGTFSLSLAIGGSTAYENGGYGNVDAKNGGLIVAGLGSVGEDSFLNNVKAWSLSGLSLTSGDTIDAYVGQGYGGGNTMTKLTITGVQAVPEPASFAALSLGALALVRKRKAVRA